MRLFKRMFFPLLILIVIAATVISKKEEVVQEKEEWIKQSREDWPDIALVNDINVIDGNKKYRNTGCGFLVDTGRDTLAVTAKHIYMLLQSEKLNTISFDNVIKKWRMYPKNNRRNGIELDRLINEDTSEIINKNILMSDCLVFTLKNKSDNIKPLKIREGKVRKKEKLFVIGWSEDSNSPVNIYEGKFVGSLGEKMLIDMKGKTSDVGFGGAPVIDSKGYLIGVLSTSQGGLSKPSSVFYLKEVIKEFDEEKYPESNKSRRFF